MAASAIWNHQAPQAHSPATANPMTSGAGATANSAAANDSSSTISSNDFLTLLVTEMKNQDPTNATDPNQYINQLVSVNSLQQLIQMNQTLAAAVYLLEQQGSGSGGSGSGGTGSGDSSAKVSSAGPTEPRPQSPVTQHNEAVQITSGNLGVAKGNPAAQRVAQALAGRAHLDAHPD